MARTLRQLTVPRRRSRSREMVNQTSRFWRTLILAPCRLIFAVASNDQSLSSPPTAIPTSCRRGAGTTFSGKNDFNLEGLLTVRSCEQEVMEGSALTKEGWFVGSPELVPVGRPPGFSPLQGLAKAGCSNARSIGCCGAMAQLHRQPDRWKPALPVCLSVCQHTARTGMYASEAKSSDSSEG